MLAALLLLAGSAFGQIYPDQSAYNHTCILNTSPALSCTKSANLTLTPNIDSCCVETFGGLVLATQFWNTYTGLESEGQLLPEKVWGIHGLWPDYCDGSYTQWCDLNHQYDPDPDPSPPLSTGPNTTAPPWAGASFDTFIEEFGRLDLLAYLNKFWIARGQPNYELWAHEYSKHATCFTTFQPQCYGPKYTEREEIIDYLESTVALDKRLPTYDWLSEAGITPSNSTKYSLSEFQETLYERYGGVPFVGCSGPRYNETDAGAGTSDRGRTYVSETWYFSNVYGRPQDGHYLPVNSTTPSSCASTEGALSYPLRSEGSERKV